MQQDQEPELENLKTVMRGKPSCYDPEQSLQRVLSRAKQQTNTRDVMSFFASWIWVLFAGFGASMHQAYHGSGKNRGRPQVKRPVNKMRPAGPSSGAPTQRSSDYPHKPQSTSE
ncbi:hypothetical protein FT643_04205 [Ketobacter sp. MCCC 1A13808]|uniref:hypothetical protein n=1 Tax=Ketobacter sp. MCCC 1A13808 TaxID=2602738 RepID=UPI000F2CC8C1|nr:hypothetical protein [Ketobacter sp. MCCC 1A13808]MVF11341.1 hypothetical protein [Ketobacter sp. MCCC 1A13808]RLP54716.1 MAG: hypothetical protein D6160_09940 [Ketobacter sp.]